jgi:hypothetical protein
MFQRDLLPPFSGGLYCEDGESRYQYLSTDYKASVSEDVILILTVVRTSDFKQLHS